MTTSPLEALFEKVVARISSSSPSSSNNSNVGTDTKLRLYGLYKHCTAGPCPGDGSSWNPTEIAKRRAWKACQSMDQDDARMEYVKLAASVSKSCQELLEDYQTNFAKADAKEDKAQGLEKEKNGSAPSNKVTPFDGDDFGPDIPVKKNGAEPPLGLLGWLAWVARVVFFWIFGTVQPVFPRGCLDIGWSDIWFAFWACWRCFLQSTARCRQMEDNLHAAIVDLWKQHASQSLGHKEREDKRQQDTDVVVGYSVRSLLYLYLMHKQYPPQAGKEVVVVPPINIPGMVDIMEHYGLVVVPVDTSPTEVDLKKVQAAISDRTVAIMVVHPFGTTSMSSEEFAKLRTLADVHEVEIWEDAAECYRGIEQSCGSPHADVTFISFGLIKTATALGGGVAILRDQSIDEEPSNAAEAMRRLQSHHYPMQSTWHYLYSKVMQAMLIQFYSDHPFAYGCFVQLCLWWGGYAFLDRIVTRNLRSIVVPDNDKTPRLGLIRMRPCLPLLQLLHRRLCNSAKTAKAVDNRVKKSHMLTRALEKHAPSLGVLPESGNPSTRWVYPVQLDPEKKPQIQAYLLKQGWETAAGTSQLHAVQPTSSHHQPPRQVQGFMKKVLYLPVPGRNLTQQQCIDLAKHLQKASAQPNQGIPKRKGGNVCFNASQIALLSTLLVVFFTGSGYKAVVRFALAMLLPRALSLLLAGFLVTVVAAVALRSLGSSMWLEYSTGFAQYNSMVDALSTNDDEKCDQTKQGKPQAQPNAGKLASVPALALPTDLTTLPEGVAGCALLTGVTGFAGSMLLRDLLFHRKALNIAGGVFVICRKKRTKTAHERIAELLEDDMFSFLTDDEKQGLVHVLEGDVSEHDAGLSSHDMERLLSLPNHGLTVTHVIHSAAAVSFTQPLADAATANIASTLTMQAMTERLGHGLEGDDDTKNLPQPKYVHLSTAFVHGDNAGTQDDPLPESLFPLDPWDPVKLYESMLGTQFYASKAMSDLRFHNTYAFTKCVAEHLLLQESNAGTSRVKTLIIRPSIVGPSVEFPWEGWGGSKPSTITGAAALYMTYQWNVWSFRDSRAPCIPVDVVSRFVLNKAFKSGAFVTPDGSESSTPSVDGSSSEVSFERVSSISSVQSISQGSFESEETSEGISSVKRIYTAAWNDSSSAEGVFRWHDFVGAVMHLGAIMGYFNRSTGYFTMLVRARLIDRLQVNYATFELLHYYLAQRPMQMMMYLCRSLGWKDLGRKLSKLSSVADLPLLFFPYTNQPFHFESELAAPANLEGRRYAFSCAVAAHRFLSRMKTRNKSADDSTASDSRRMSSLVIGGQQHQDSFNLFWALTQPKGSLIVRLTGWMFAKVLRATCTMLSVDLSSFEAVIEHRLKAEQASDYQDKGPLHLVLAPTHRSFFDFIILSYLAFAIPELHIDIPKIAAADDFENLPVVGWLACRLGAFYLRRGRGRADPHLTKTLAAMKQSGPTVFEVFLEGSRSRDRRFMTPKTGMLRSLAASGGRHLLVPIAISYEKIPEQDVLGKEASGVGNRKGLNAGGLVRWLLDVARGKVFLGRIHVAAAEPSLLVCKSPSDYMALARSIQLKQQQAVYCSDYHVKAASELLEMDSQSLRDAMAQVGCRFFPMIRSLRASKEPVLPQDPSEQWTLLLQCGHNLAKLCCNDQNWCAWLNPTAVDGCSAKVSESLARDPDVAKLSAKLLEAFAKAQSEVESAYEKLTGNGFKQPNLNHLKNAAFKNIENGEVPCLLLTAAAQMHRSQMRADDSSTQTTCEVSASPRPPRLQESEERLGFWGYHDSGFALQVSKKGSRYVSMLGNRYSLCGKSLSKLIPFIAEETHIAIDPFKEAFKCSPRVATMESAIGEDGLNLLRSSVAKMTIAVADRMRHGTGHAQEDVCAIRDPSANGFRIPDAVVWPTSEKEVESLIKLAKEQRWCIIPFGGGTNVTQATRCPPESVEPRPILSVDMTKMNRLLWLNPEDGLACFEAGINGRDLVETLQERGLTMGHEPDSIEFSTLGGWVATKASGMKRNKYGNIEDIVRDVRIVGGSGPIWQKGDGQHQKPKPIFGREACGLDFKSLLIGSEGCLGIITSVVVKVWKTPEVKEYESVMFTSFEHGLGFVRDVAKLDLMIPASVRLLDNEHFRLGQALQADTTSVMERMRKIFGALYAAKSMATLDLKSIACATIGFEGSKAEVQLQRRAIQRLANEHGGLLLGPNIGRAGYDMTFMIAYLRDFALTYHFLGESFETFVPWSRIPSVIEKTKAKIKQEHAARCLPGDPFVGCRVTQLYHDGACLYFYFCMNTENVDEASRVYSEIEHVARAEVLKQGGSLSHHHGIGKVRADFLKESTTTDFKEILSALKDKMDPENIFAAGNGLFG